MEFCPTCGVFLLYELPNMGKPARYYCSTCPYVCSIEHRVKVKKKQHLVKKEVEPVFSLEDMMKGGSETEGKIDACEKRENCDTEELILFQTATCPHCNFGRARYQQIQIRSADEPATTFYLCLNEKCGRMWRED